MSPQTILIAGVVALLVLIPSRRLWVTGRSRDTVTAYFLLVWLLGTVAATVPSTSRFLIPVLLVAFVVPFVTWRQGLDRVFGRRAGPGGGREPAGPAERPPMKNVTPPERPTR